ncbi:hypothetical protein [Nitrobacter sp. JJSN]|uniref:hypothetical protein n=1 Tax=Nitrobacter sp. JJSN TaxID=3453033 RepID=UPI003F77144B
MAKKYNIKTAFGTDILFSEALSERQGATLSDMTRWYTVPVGNLIRLATEAESRNASAL